MTAPVPLLLPGNMCDSRLWTQAVRDALPGARDIALRTETTIDAMARKALAETDGPVLPVGFSMGGIVALAMARLAPERIAAMILLDTNASADLPERAAVRPRQQAAVRGGDLERIVVEELKPNYLAAVHRGNRALLDLLRDMAMGLGDDCFVAQSEALRTRPDQRAVPGQLAVPLLLACGAEDRLCPPEWHRAMADCAHDATLHVIEGSGHMLPLEQPEALAAIITAWRDR
ncbi:alpha/beta fold hydrolase [Blastomonas sp. UPD001]|uniref:alpha/beta fold hydrolase n=1 Tax=Blastomonas sp. UPD001 TaxID=2217673 RepID=UPI00336BE227